MKRKIAMTLLTVMTLSLAACGGQDDTTGSQSSQPTSGVEQSAQQPSSSEASSESSAEVANQIASALDLINTVWAKTPDDQKFPVGGGDSANLNFEGAAVFDVTKTDELNTTLGFPADQADKIDDAASMMNAMMANNFTAGVFHVTDAANVEAVAEAIKNNIMTREWMCGMPEKLIVVSVDNYIVAAFGINDFINPFNANISAAYSNAVVLYEEALIF